MCDSTKSDVCHRRVPEIELTGKLTDAMEKVLTCNCLSDATRTSCENVLGHSKSVEPRSQVVPIRLVKDIYRVLKAEGHKVFLHEMLEGTTLVPQTVKLPPRNPELEERVRKLKIEEENREYKRMTRNVDRKGKSNFTFNEEVKSMNRQMIGVLNFLITVAAGFAFGYKGCELMFGKIFAMQMLSGLILGTVVFFADLYFLLNYGPM